MVAHRRQGWKQDLNRATKKEIKAVTCTCRWQTNVTAQQQGNDQSWSINRGLYQQLSKKQQGSIIGCKYSRRPKVGSRWAREKLLFDPGTAVHKFQKGRALQPPWSIAPSLTQNWFPQKYKAFPLPHRAWWQISAKRVFFFSWLGRPAWFHDGLFSFCSQ